MALEKEMRRNLIAPPQEEREKFIADIATRQKYNTVDDFYASIGYGGISLEKIMPRVKDDFIRLYRKPEQTLAPTVKKTSQKASNGVIVEGLDGCLIKFARCCNPLPGDEIVGFITRGFGGIYSQVRLRQCGKCSSPWGGSGAMGKCHLGQ